METVELYERDVSAYRCVRTCGSGETIECDLFPGSRIVVDEFFDTQLKRHGYEVEPDTDEPRTDWLVPADTRLGLQRLLSLGHAERRYEIWRGRGQCTLAFGSIDEARLRFQHFLEDICRWEQVARAHPSPVEPDVEMAEVGRFRLLRRHRLVELEVVYPPSKVRELYDTWFASEHWDWGEND